MAFWDFGWQGADKKVGAQQWVGEMLSAAEFDNDGVLTQAMIRVTDERCANACTWSYNDLNVHYVHNPELLHFPIV